jgi:hypothetical protein
MQMLSRITGFAGSMPMATPPDRPSLPPPPANLNPGVQTAMIHFLVHPMMPEISQYAQQAGWLERGFTVLSIPWLEMHYTTDDWVTSRVLKSTDVPCPVINGWFYLAHVRAGEEVEFAVHAGIGCRTPEDRSGLREEGSLWFNNGGPNYKQLAR